MPSLRDYRDRIKSVKSTRKITSAMKMVAVSKLRRAQEQAERSQPYANAMAEMLARVAANVVVGAGSSKLLTGTGSDQRHMVVVVTADRGLCGGFNANIIKLARAKIRELRNEGKDVQIVFAGRKGHDGLRGEFPAMIKQRFSDLVGKGGVEFAQANKVAEYILDEFAAGHFDVCTLIYSEFVSVLTQQPVLQQLIPFKAQEESEAKKKAKKTKQDNSPVVQVESPYDFEPSEEEILDKLLPRNLGIQLYRALLDSAAGEQAAKMTAMDNATRNAGEMIADLTLQYNRARQAHITKELIEIISGAEAL